MLHDKRPADDAGLRPGAYFLGNVALNLVDITIQPAVYMSVYYTLTLPEISFVHYYGGDPCSSYWRCFPSCYTTL